MIRKFVIVALLLAVGACSKPRPQHVFGAYDGCNTCSQETKEVAWSLDHEHRDWAADGWSIGTDNWPKGGYIFRVSNGSSGVAATKGNIPGLIALNEDEQVLLYRAYQRWVQAEALGEDDP